MNTWTLSDRFSNPRISQVEGTCKDHHRFPTDAFTLSLIPLRGRSSQPSPHPSPELRAPFCSSAHKAAAGGRQVLFIELRMAQRFACTFPVLFQPPVCRFLSGLGFCKGIGMLQQNPAGKTQTSLGRRGSQWSGMGSCSHTESTAMSLYFQIQCFKSSPPLKPFFYPSWGVDFLGNVPLERPHEQSPFLQENIHSD